MIHDDRYTLATGELGANRLQILHQVHKPYTEFLLKRVGLTEGMHIADIGCGIGSVSTWLGKQVGLNGSVIGGDAYGGLFGDAPNVPKSLTVQMQYASFPLPDGHT